MTVTEISTQELTYYKFHEYNFYIDAQNVHKSLQYYHQRTIDWGRFMVYCKERFQATQVKIFFGYVQKYQTLYNSLRSYGYEICFKETLILPDGTIKWNVDIDIAIVAVRDFYEWNATHTYLVTGDWDYNSLVDFWKEKWIFGSVLVPWIHNSSQLLSRVAQKKIIDIAPMKRKLQKENPSIATWVS